MPRRAVGRPTFLVVQNAPWEGPGIIASQLEATSVTMEVAELHRRGAAVPLDEIEGGRYAGVFSLGSPSTAYLQETNPHHVEMAEMFRLVRRLRVPSFDVCYSMQLFSLVHGGRVSKNQNGKEVGLFDVHLTREGKGDAVFGSVGDFTTLQWHGDCVTELPPGAVRLGSSKRTENQLAVLDGIHYLVQGDGQAATPAMVESWAKHDAEWVKGAGFHGPETVQRVAANEAYFRNTFLRIVGNFLALAIRRPAVG